MFKILWIDDEIELLESLVKILQDNGYEVFPVSEFSSARKVLEGNVINLVLLDEIMPQKKGTELIENIKEVSPRSKIVMLTQCSEDDTINRAVYYKVDGYLVKPVDPVQLLTEIKFQMTTEKILDKEDTDDVLKTIKEDSYVINNIDANPDDWYSVVLNYAKWQNKFHNINDDIKETIESHYKELEIHFSRFFSKNYLDWLNKYSDLFSPGFIKRFLEPLYKQKIIALIVLDSVRIDQWLVLEELLPKDLKYERKYQLSLIPSATPYSRNAIFSSLYPDEIAKIYPGPWQKVQITKLSLNAFEEELFKNSIKKILKREDVYYFQVFSEEEIIGIRKKLSGIKSGVIGISVNILDFLLHLYSKTQLLQEIAPTPSAYSGLIKTWFLNSNLRNVIEILNKKGASFIFTSDHGSVQVKKGSLVTKADKDTSPGVRFKFGKNLGAEKGTYFDIKKPEDYRLPVNIVRKEYIIALGDYFFYYPNEKDEFIRRFENSFQHGGISIPELFCFVGILSKE